MEQGNPKLFCFLNDSRPCGPDCMAYNVVHPAGQDYANQQWASCMWLVNAHRVGKHIVALTSIVESATKKMRAHFDDQARGNQPPPPVVK